MEKITSFTIDHIKLQPGIYVSRKDPVGGSMITTFDIRMTSPNEEPVMNTADEEKSASDKTEADNTIIHQPDGETGEKSENVQEQIGKESEAPAKISAPTPSQTGENIKEIRLVCQNSTKKKIQRTFGSEIFCKIKGEDNFIVTVEVVVDKAFFGWLTSMGRNVHILKPKKAAVAYRDYLKNIAKDYKGIDK